MNLYTHPANVELLTAHCERLEQPATNGFIGGLRGIFGLEVVAVNSMPKTRETGRFLYPKDPFVEYEDSDNEWALPLGFAKRETEPYFLLEDPRWRLELPRMPMFSTAAY